MVRAAIYTRISVDADGTQTATRRQEEAARRFVALRDWTTVDVFEDVDVSAYKASVLRPAFERLLVEIASGSLDVVVVWRLDRLVRRPADFERCWSACERSGTAIVSVTEPIDTTSEIGLAMVRILVTFAGLESSIKSARLKAKFAETARRGEPAYRRRVYGLNAGWTETVPHEAAVIREASARVLADEPLKVIVEDLNRRAIPSPGGMTWTRRGLRTLLVSTRHAGERWHHGEKVATGNWPAILDPITAARVRAALADAGRRPAGHRQDRALLRGLLRCGKCGAMLGPSGPARGTYICRGKPRGCGGVSVRAADVERWVTQLIAWCQQAAIDVDAHSDPAASLERHASALHELSVDYYARRAISRGEFLAARDQLRRTIPLLPPAAETTALPPDDENAAAESRRRLIFWHLRSITVAPNPTGGVFNPGRLEVEWRHAPPQQDFTPTPPYADGDSSGERWLSLHEAAARLGVATSTVQRWCRQNQLAYHRDARQFRFSRAELDGFIAARRVVPGTVSTLHPPTRPRSRTSGSDQSSSPPFRGG